MKKILLFILFSLSYLITQGQFCSTTALSNRGNLIPTGTFQNVSGNASFKNYWTFTATAGCTYDFSTCSGPNTNDTYLRLYQGTTPTTAILRAQNDDNGSFCAGAKASLSWTCPTSGTYSILLTNYSCANLSASTTLSYRVICSAPSGCTNTSAFGSATAPTTPTPLTISTCTYQSEYNTISGVVAGRTYQSSYNLGGYITIRHSTSGGTVVAQGNSPLNWTATISGTYYIHYNTTSTCGTASNCGTSTITCTSCLPPPPISVSVGCTGTNFFDSGGNGGNYSINEDRTYIYCPQNSTDKVTINFTSFDIESNFDYLYVYNGNSTSATLIGTFTGTTSIGPFTSTNTNGCLTFRFTSDGSVNLTGWAANALLTPLVAPIHNTTMLEGCVGINPSVLNFVTLPSGGSQPYNYQWLENGNLITGANTTSYDPPTINSAGIYQFYVRVTDACGNVITSSPKEVRVAPDPTITTATQVGVGCVGDSVTLINPQYGLEPGAFCPFEYSSSIDNLTWTTPSNTIPSFYVNYASLDTNYIRMRVSGGCANGCNASPWMIYKFYNEPSLCAILPIYLSSFTGENEGRVNHLYWVTTQEINSSHFEIEKSKDGINFNYLGRVNANNTNPYEFVDESAFYGNNYYRLKIIDLDGVISYSNIIVIDAQYDINFNVYPNPFNDLIVYSYYTEEPEELEIEIFNTLGQIVFRNTTKCDACINAVNINVKDLTPGNYTLKIKHLKTNYVTKQTIIKK